MNALVGMPVPDVYSAGLSEFVFAAGVRLMERDRPEIMYLSTTDYIQHKHAPGTPVANDFYAMMDGYLAQLDAMGCTIVLTADHGMNAKFGADGQPDVIYLQDLFDDWARQGQGARHPADHRSLRRASRRAGLVRRRLSATGTRRAGWRSSRRCPAIEPALTKEEAAKRFELPADRLGDLVVVSTKHKVLGTSASRHDLSGLTEPLRSHGGVSEQKRAADLQPQARRPVRSRRGATSTPSISPSTSSPDRQDKVSVLVRIKCSLRRAGRRERFAPAPIPDGGEP